MIITEKVRPFKVKFQQLSIGEVFKYRFLFQEKELVLMKIGDSIEELNAVNLVDGETHGLAEDALCEPVEAELTIYPNNS